MSAYSDAILSDNPVVYYRLDDDVSPLVADIAQDTFANRTASGSFGTASDGEVYQVLSNTHAVVTVGSGEGIVYYDNAGSGFCSYSVLLGSQTVADATHLIRLNFLSLSGGPEFYLYARYVDANNWYRVHIASPTVELQINVGGSQSTTSLGSFPLTPGTPYFLRFTLLGSTLSVTIWQSGTFEPNIPNWTVSDTSVSSPGQFGFIVIVIQTTPAAGIAIDSYSVSTHIVNDITVADSSGNSYDGSVQGSALVRQPGAIRNDPDTAIIFAGTPGVILLPSTIVPQSWNTRSVELWTKWSGIYEHIVLTYDGTTVTTYLNGSAYTGGGVGDQVLIASDLSFVGSTISGTLDEVAYYDHPLTAAQVAWHFQMGLFGRSGIAVFPDTARRSGDFPETQRRGAIA